MDFLMGGGIFLAGVTFGFLLAAIMCASGRR